MHYRYRNTRHTARRLAGVPALVAALCFLWPAPALAAPEDIADKEITQAIESEMVLDAAVASHLVDVTTTEGIVTLSGSVDNVLARDRAVAIAEATKGVRSVIDRIKVSPPKRGDREIADDVKTALLTDPAADSYEVSATCSDGVVTLTGGVESWAEKRLAEYVAKGVRGVKKVVNNISVNYKKKRTDSEIKAEIERRLEMDVRVDDALIDVAVKDAQVTLSGTVGSSAEEWRAETDAWVAGVQSVNTEDLTIEWWARDRMARTYEEGTPSDEAIEKAIQDAFLYDPRVLSYKPEVEVDGGVATLTGEVGSLSAKQAAEETAEHTVGVWRVKNHLRVRPEKRPADSVLAERVRQALERDPYVDRFDLSVVVVNGKAYLYGTVDTTFEKTHAESVASRVNGVIEVQNNLGVRAEWAWKDDQAIREDIEDQLYWNPHVDADDITVTVVDGVATLGGTVDSWFEYDEVTQEAWDGGAKEVHNHLRVRNAAYVPSYE